MQVHTGRRLQGDDAVLHSSVTKGITITLKQWPSHASWRERMERGKKERSIITITMGEGQEIRVICEAMKMAA